VNKTLRFLLGGAAAGAVLGAALGYGLSRAHKLLPDSASPTGVRRRMNATQAFQLGVSIFGIIRQLIEMGR